MQQEDASFLHSVHDFRKRWGRSPFRDLWGWSSPQTAAISGAVNDEYHFTAWSRAGVGSSSITQCWPLLRDLPVSSNRASWWLTTITGSRAPAYLCCKYCTTMCMRVFTEEGGSAPDHTGPLSGSAAVSNCGHAEAISSRVARWLHTWPRPSISSKLSCTDTWPGGTDTDAMMLAAV